MPDEPFEAPPANAETLPAADVVPANNESVFFTSYQVKRSEEELAEFFLPMRASTLKRCRSKLSTVKSSFSWAEFSLAVSMLTGGAFLGGLLSETKIGTPLGILFFVVFPVIAVGALVAYFFLRKLGIQEAERIAKDVLDELPDPSKAQ